MLAISDGVLAITDFWAGRSYLDKLSTKLLQSVLECFEIAVAIFARLSAVHARELVRPFKGLFDLKQCRESLLERSGVQLR